jgi:hypothetical protein
MQKIKFFGEWSRQSDVVFDSFDPTILPTRELGNYLDG